MIRHPKAKRPRKGIRKARRRIRTTFGRQKNLGRINKRRQFVLSDRRLQRGLSVLRELNDLFAAARAARTTPKRFAAAALKKGAIRKRGKRWVVTRKLPRQMLVYSAGRELIVTVPNAASASLVGRYMAAVRQFLRTNQPDVLVPFSDRPIKDTAGNSHPFETNPNVVFRLALTGECAFEEIYRIIV